MVNLTGKTIFIERDFILPSVGLVYTEWKGERKGGASFISPLKALPEITNYSLLKGEIQIIFSEEFFLLPSSLRDNIYSELFRWTLEEKIEALCYRDGFLQIVETKERFILLNESSEDTKRYMEEIKAKKEIIEMEIMKEQKKGGEDESLSG